MKDSNLKWTDFKDLPDFVKDQIIAKSDRLHNFWWLNKSKILVVTSSPKPTWVMDDIIDRLMPELKEHGFPFPPQHSVVADRMKTLRIILTNLWHAYISDPDRYIAYSRDEGYYSRTRKKYKKINPREWQFSYSYVVDAVNFLIDCGYVEHEMGYKYEDTGTGHVSKMRATAKLIDFMAQSMIIDNPEGDPDAEPEFIETKVERETTDTETIIFKGKKPETKWEPVYWNDGNFKKLRKISKPRKECKTPNTPAVRKTRDNLKIINDLLMRTDIRLNVNEQELKELNRKLNSERDPYRRAVDFTKKTLHRVFLDRSIKLGGRFYGGWWEGIPKEYRQWITINGSTVIEPDFAAYHINILYSLEGLPIPEDYPYHLNGFSNSDDNTKFLKRALLVILNTSGKTPEKARNQVINRLKFEIQEGKLIQPPEMQDIGDVIDRFSEKHKPISKHFFTGYGTTLQNIDSQIAEEILLFFAEQGEPVLPVHDSFIIRHTCSLALHVKMSQIFNKRFGTHVDIKNEITALDKGFYGVIKDFFGDDYEEILDSFTEIKN